MINSAERAGARKVHLIEEPVAAAIGVGLPVSVAGSASNGCASSTSPSMNSSRPEAYSAFVAACAAEGLAGENVPKLAPDAQADPGVSVLYDIPADSHPPITYPAAQVSDSPAAAACSSSLPQTSLERSSSSTRSVRPRAKGREPGFPR